MTIHNYVFFSRHDHFMKIRKLVEFFFLVVTIRLLSNREDKVKTENGNYQLYLITEGAVKLHVIQVC